jgi:mannose-6-phosphate isomerase-like protein (cupin superfamily)
MRRSKILAALLLAGGAQAATEDPRLQPGQLRLLDLDWAQLREVVPGAVYMRHWFGTDQSTALFRFPPAAASAAPATLAFHSHGTELAVQVAGDSEIVDERGRHYPLREGDVVLVKANVRHTGTFGGTENRILSVVTPARPEYPPEDGAAYFPGHGQPAAKAAPPRTDYKGPTVGTLCNLGTVEPTLLSYAGGVAFRHWHGDGVSVAVTRLRADGSGHVAAAHAVHGEELAWVVRGQMAYALTGGAQVTAGAGQAVVLPPYRAHSAQCLAADCLIVSWHGPRRDEWGAPGSLPPLRFVTTGAGEVAAPVKTQCPCESSTAAAGPAGGGR